MNLEKRLQLEKLYKKRRIFVKILITGLLLMILLIFFKKYIPKEIPLNVILLVLFFGSQFPLLLLIRKIPPILCDSESFKEEHLTIFYKSIVYGTGITLCLSVSFTFLSRFFKNITIETVCITFVFSTVIASLIAFLILDKMERRKAKSEIESLSSSSKSPKSHIEC